MIRQKKDDNNCIQALPIMVDCTNTDIKTALVRFKKKIKQSRLLVELKEKSFYKKPSEKRRAAKNLGIIRAKYNFS